jgi:TIR domain
MDWGLNKADGERRLRACKIAKRKAAAVFVGENNLGPWTNMELDAFIREFIQRDCPVIPVVLPSVTSTPDLPLFLRGMHWVDFRNKDPNPLDQLIWGITGNLNVLK